ncbi:MAG: hypothetical protein HOQ26_12205 [Gemmatimonadaceae bacterium]|nr:hypothetical protein [Gemmatimonadaceae bacterium]
MHISRISSPIAFVVALGAACGCNGLLIDNSVASVEIAPRAVELVPGDSTKITATILGPDGSPVSRPVIRWSSSDSTIVQVSASGTVRPIRGGTAVVTAAAGRYSDSGLVRGVYPPLSGVIEYAHRAFGGIFPENTLTAVNGAFERGANGVEVDVRLSSDGLPVVMHDPTVDRTTNGHGEVDQLTFGQLRSLDACARAGGQWPPCQVPTPFEVLSAAQHRGRVILDLKGPWPS